MKFLKVTTFYADYLAQFYARRSALAQSSYRQQRQVLMADCFGWADFFERELGKLGYEADELVINVEAMQRAWAAENGFTFPSDGWLLEVAYEQIRRFDPEVLFLDDVSTFPVEWISRVRAACRNVRLILGWSGAPTARVDAFASYDAVLSCVPELLSEIELSGAKAFHLNHAFDPTVLTKLDVSQAPKVDLSFVGQIVPGSRFHDERRRLLTALAERFDLHLYTPVPARSPLVSAKNAAKPVLRAIAGGLDRALRGTGLRGRIPLPPAASNRYDETPQLSRSLNRLIHPPVFGVQMFQALRDSRMTMNSHIGTSRRSASNMRLFEATGVGACLITDRKDNLDALFGPDGVVSYGSVDECVEKITYLLSHPDEVAAIGRRGQKRTLELHTFEQRAHQLDEMIRRLC